MRPATGRAHGKVILFGDHFAVHGAPALAVPMLGRFVEVTVDRDRGGYAGPEEAREWLAAALAEVGATYGLDPLRPPFVGITSTLPVAAGLGSSAALAVALLKALGETEVLTLRARAHALERIAHGRPSGIDDATVAFARPVWLEAGALAAGHAPTPFEAPAPPLWVGVVPRTQPTKASVAQVGAWRRDHPEAFEGLLARAHVAAVQGRAALERADWPSVGEQMNEMGDLLDAVGAVLPVQRALIAAARERGAWGAKVAGAGFGGAVVALGPRALDLGAAWRAVAAEAGPATLTDAFYAGASEVANG